LSRFDWLADGSMLPCQLFGFETLLFEPAPVQVKNTACAWTGTEVAAAQRAAATIISFQEIPEDDRGAKPHESFMSEGTL
jgi:hypothetical protein